MKQWFFLLSLFSATIAHASDPKCIIILGNSDASDTNTFGPKAKLSRLVIKGVPGYKEVEENPNLPAGFITNPPALNYVRIAEAEVPPSVRDVFEQVTALNKKVTDLLEISADVFPDLDLTIQGSSAGPLTSDDAITLGVFESWAGHKINSAIYLHELGHVLSSRTFFAEPVFPVANKLAQSPLFVEAFADWLAISIENGIISSEADFPRGLQNARSLGHVSSFDLPAKVFTGQYANENLFRELKANPSQPGTPAAMNEKHLLHLLAEARKDPMTEKVGDLPLSSLDSLWGLDPHQLGIPVNAFLVSLNARLGRPLVKEFLRALKMDVDANKNYPKFSYAISGVPTPEAERIVVTVPTVGGFFKTIRDLLPTKAEQASFDTAWKLHRMDIGIQLADKDTVFFGAREARDVMRDRFEANGGKGTGVYRPGVKGHSEEYVIEHDVPLDSVESK